MASPATGSWDPIDWRLRRTIPLLTRLMLARDSPVNLTLKLSRRPRAQRVGGGWSALLCDVLQAICKVMASSRGWQWRIILPVEVNGLFDDLAQLIEDLAFIVAVAPAEDQPGRTPDVALIFF